MSWDVLVVGGGHAGVEAAAAAGRLGARTALVTLRLDRIGALSCNPAFGGMGKGHLVRELDALGGLVGRAADRAAVQVRRLNTRKGLAVQATRVQVDVDLYPEVVQARLAALPVERIAGEVASLRLVRGRVAGVVLTDGSRLEARAVVLATGTFLGGELFVGEERVVGGRRGEPGARRLSVSLRELGLTLVRLKTGTVPRLDGGTVAWDRTEPQTDLWPEGRFSFGAPQPRPEPLQVHVTHTTPRTHAIIRGGLDRSPLYTGGIEGAGPRYCPSIEDKVVRFPDRERHLVFLEPEGHRTHAVYPNGLPTSLPRDVQLDLLRSVPGLEAVEVLQWGYAVEYDSIDPRVLGHDLQHRDVPGLFFAGQVCGTSGYEEAAAQGFVAGVSAATGGVFHVERDKGYVGVLVDDLVTRGVGGEPYRMFTSRAEHRLLLREDNADRRLMPRGRELGLIDDATWARFAARQEARVGAAAVLQATTLRPDRETQAALAARGLAPLSKPSPAEALLRRPEVRWDDLVAVAGLPAVEEDVAEQLEIDVKYAGYVERARRRAAAARRQEGVRLPVDVDWEELAELSAEVRERLRRACPTTLGQVARMPGVTPAAVGAIASWLARRTER